MFQQQKQTGFLVPGRPKKWRAMAFDIFEKVVQTRIEGTHVDERDSNKMWLVRYLEVNSLFSFIFLSKTKKWLTVNKATYIRRFKGDQDLMWALFSSTL